MRIKVLVCCSDQVWAQRLRAALAVPKGPGAGGHLHGLEWVDASTRPDIVLLEWAQGERGMRERLVHAVATASSGVLVACERWTREMLVEALECGVRACILKASPLPMLQQALYAIQRGESWLCSAAVSQALGVERGAVPLPVAPESGLTPREHQILRLIGLGMSNKEIGRQLAISEHTVKTHLHRVYVKLNRSGRYKAFLSQPAEDGFLPAAADMTTRAAVS